MFDHELSKPVRMVALAWAAVLAACVGGTHGFSMSPGLALRTTCDTRFSGVCANGRIPRARGSTAVRMEGDRPTSSLGKELGRGLADFSKDLRVVDEDDRTGKEAIFGGREAAIKAAAEKDLEDMAGGEMARSGQIPIPEPIIMNPKDIERQVWRVQVDKSGNWFSGNYCPDDFLVALGPADDGNLEFGGDSWTKGKWYLDNDCLYIERRPFGFLGPFGPGKEYYRVSLTGWATDENKIQMAGYVSGFSPLFPVAILGRCLMTRQKVIAEDDLKQKIRAAAGKVQGAASPAQLEGGKGSSTKKRLKIVDLSDDLTDEELLKKEAAEWMPSTIIDKKGPTIVDKLQDNMGGSLERLKGTLEESIDNYNKIKD